MPPAPTPSPDACAKGADVSTICGKVVAGDRRRADGAAAQGMGNTARGAALFLRETLSRVRYAGATGALTVRADSGFYTREIVAEAQDA